MKINNNPTTSSHHLQRIHIRQRFPLPLSSSPDFNLWQRTIDAHGPIVESIRSIDSFNFSSVQTLTFCTLHYDTDGLISTCSSSHPITVYPIPYKKPAICLQFCMH